jgi:hypothetical protein
MLDPGVELQGEGEELELEPGVELLREEELGLELELLEQELVELELELELLWLLGAKLEQMQPAAGIG